MNIKEVLNLRSLAAILGGVTFVLFAAEPYLLELIAPSKSIGSIIGENAKDLIDGLNGKNGIGNTKNSPREIWSIVITLLAFIFFAAAIISAAFSWKHPSKQRFGIAGAVLSVAGLGIYIAHLAIGLIGFIVLCILIVALVFLQG